MFKLTILMEDRLNLQELKGLWLIVKGKVYDVTNFKSHPGGYDILQSCKGKDATDQFIQAGHPDYVEEEMLQYYKGEVPVIHQEEVAKHKEEEDVWVAIHGKVYDVSKFKKHPGGYDILIESAGKDSTVEFDNIDHSRTAKEDLFNYYIGEYVPGEALPAKKSGLNYLIVIPILIIIVAVILNTQYF